MQRQMSLKHHYLDNGVKDTFEMQIQGMTCILGAGINSVQAGYVCVCVYLVCDMNSSMGVSVHVRVRALWRYLTKW